MTLKLIKKFISWIVIFQLTFFSSSYVWAQEIGSLALPQGGSVVSGQVNIDYAAVDRLNVNQASNQAVVNWQSFNVGRDASVHFNQPGSKASILNKVLSGQSIINGKIYSNGRLFLINPTGILTGPNSAIRAEGAVLSTLNLSQQNYLNNNLQFNTNTNSSLVNQGLIEGQYVALMAPQVNNQGTIVSGVATTIAAGDDMLLGISNSNNLTIKISPSKLQAMAKNEGTIKTQNGMVTIKTDAAQSLVDDIIKLPNAKATGLVSENGVIKLVSNSGSIKANKIKIDAGSKGATEISGILNSNNENGKGGTIEITGKDIDVNSATISADGKTGGGEILLGGDWQGSGDLLQATYINIDDATTISADALESGSGGTIVAWSDIKNANSFTKVSGTLSAKGIDGSGGQIETSGADLDINGIRVNTSSVSGSYGNWLVDPTDLTIDASAASTYASNLASSDVTLTADNTITLDSAITYSGARDSTLIFNATTTVLNANVTSSNGTLSLDINTAVTLGSDVTITTNGGYFDVSGNIQVNSNVGIIELRNGGQYLYNNGSVLTADGSSKSIGNGSLTYSSGSFTWTKPTSLTSTDLLVLAGGGGGGGSYVGGGGGAGGLIQKSSYSLSAETYAITIGAGGAGSPGHGGKGTNGGNTVFGSLTATGGGGGGACNCSSGGNRDGNNGGSGGGASFHGGTPGSGTSGQGNAGASTTGGRNRGGGGGGAGGAGGLVNGEGTNGGIGIQSSITGTAKWYAGGGGAGTDGTTGETYGGLLGGSGVGGAGGAAQRNGNDAVANTGSGGGGGGGHAALGGGDGSDGIVVINYNDVVSAGLTINTGSGQVNLQGNVSDLTSLTVNSNTSSQVAGVISGSTAIVKSGTGRLTTSANNTYTGGTTVSAGTLFGGAASRANNVFGSGSISVASGATLWIDRSDDGALTNALTLNGGTLRGTNGFGQYWDGDITLGAHSTIKADYNLIIDGVISGSSKNLTKTGNGNLLLRGNNTYTGSTTISAGTLTLSGSGNLGAGSYAGAIVNSGTFKFDTSANLISTGVISGSGNVLVTGTGTYEPKATNTYTGGTIIDGGIIAAFTDRNWGALPGSVDPDNIILKNGGKAIFGSKNSSNTAGHTYWSANRGINLPTSGQQFIEMGSGGSGAAHIQGVVNGIGGITFTRSGSKTIRFYGENTYTGDTKFNFTSGSNNNISITPKAFQNSTVYLSPTKTNVGRGFSRTSGSGNIILGGLAGDMTDWRLVGGRNIEFGSNNANTSVAGGISRYAAAGNLIKKGTGTTIFAATSGQELNSSSIGLQIDAGKLVLNGDWGRNNTAAGTVAIAAGATLEIDTAQNNTYSGVLSGAGTLLLGGTGTSTFSGNNTFTGALNIADGGFKAGHANSFGSATITSSGGRISTASSITLPSLTVTGNVQLDSGIATTGAQLYNNNVLVAAGSRATPVEFTTTNSDITFKGTLKGQGNAKNRSITINAGTGDLEFGNRVGFAFNGQTFNASNTADSFYKMIMTAATTTIKADVMTYEEQTYNSDIVIGSTGSNGTTRTLLSMDPKVIINGTVNDTVANTHTLVAKAIAVRRDGITPGTPNVTFNGTIGRIAKLAGYSGVTGYQVVSTNYGTIDTDTSFGSVTGGTQINGVVASRGGSQRKVKAEKSANQISRQGQQTAFNAGKNLITKLFGGGQTGGTRTFQKAIEVKTPGDVGFGGDAPTSKSQQGTFNSTNERANTSKPRNIKELFRDDFGKPKSRDNSNKQKSRDNSNSPNIVEDDEEQNLASENEPSN
ncbi:filamentous hemagglutinin N-terminal domain-containing protein [Pelagibacteraceae bacterium]|nr:filamentous hemagglutinin N-terminal domain-containing protein [Pelagibacteraceae bacterium]